MFGLRWCPWRLVSKTHIQKDQLFNNMADVCVILIDFAIHIVHLFLELSKNDLCATARTAPITWVLSAKFLVSFTWKIGRSSARPKKDSDFLEEIPSQCYFRKGEIVMSFLLV